MQFSDDESSDPDSNVLALAWYFGDGNQVSGANVEHTYTSADSLTAALIATHDEGAANNAQSIVVASASPLDSAPPTSTDITAAVYLLLGISNFSGANSGISPPTFSRKVGGLIDHQCSGNIYQQISGSCAYAMGGDSLAPVSGT